MGNMMRRGKVNPSCKCCNDDVCDGFRTREKVQWKKEAREMTESELPENASFGVWDELNYREPYTIKVSKEEWEQLEKALNEPPKASEALKRLFKGENN